MLHSTQRVQVTGCLAGTVRELLKEVPPDAHGLFVVVHMDALHDIQYAIIEVDHIALPVRFDPVSEDNPVGTVWIGYGQGNLESFIVLDAEASVPA